MLNISYSCFYSSISTYGLPPLFDISVYRLSSSCLFCNSVLFFLFAMSSIFLFFILSALLCSCIKFNWKSAFILSSISCWSCWFIWSFFWVSSLLLELGILFIQWDLWLSLLSDCILSLCSELIRCFFRNKGESRSSDKFNGFSESPLLRCWFWRACLSEFLTLCRNGDLGELQPGVPHS